MRRCGGSTRRRLHKKNDLGQDVRPGPGLIQGTIHRANRMIVDLLV